MTLTPVAAGKEDSSLTDILILPVWAQKPIGLAALWTGLLFLPAIVSPDKSPALYLILVLCASALGGAMVYSFAHFYYRDMADVQPQPLTVSLLPATFLTTLIVYQSGQWPGLSILMISVLAIIHFRTTIHGTTDLLFVFWAVLSGVLIAIGFVLPVLLLNGLICLAGFFLVNRRLSRTQYRLIVRFEQAALSRLEPVLASLNGQEVSRKEQDGVIDLVLEVSLREVSLPVVDRIAAMPGVQRATMITTNRQDKSRHL